MSESMLSLRMARCMAAEEPRASPSGRTWVVMRTFLQGLRRSMTCWYGSGMRQLYSGLNVFVELLLERFDTGKFALVAKPVENFDAKSLAVKIGGEVDQVNFDLSRVLSEC